MGPAGTYWMFRRPGARRALGGMYTKQPDDPGPPYWLPYVLVASADRAVEVALRDGGRVLHGPADVPGGDRIAVGSDPQGAAFAVHSLKPARAKPQRPKKAVKKAVKKTVKKTARKTAKRAPQRRARKAKDGAKARAKARARAKRR
jgi:predicted enzyme related to lactoylglutathione lyase